MVEHKIKINNSVLGIASILAVFLIVYFALNFTLGTSIDTSNTAADSSGYAAQAALSGDASASLCKIIVGMTTAYDDTTLAVTLEEGASATYASYTVSVVSINSNGCVVDIDGVSDYLAVGQIQKVGYLYVTVKDVVQ